MPRAGLTVDLVTRAAADLADRDGLDAVTVSAVARRFDVKPASLYGHVEGSEDLLRRVTLLSLDELADALADAVSGRAGREALGAWAGTYRTYAKEHPGRYAASRRRVDPATARASAGPRIGELTSSVLRGYAVAETDRVHAVRVASSTVHGFLELEAAGAFDHSAPAPTESWDRMVDALDTLLRHWPQ